MQIIKVQKIIASKSYNSQACLTAIVLILDHKSTITHALHALQNQWLHFKQIQSASSQRSTAFIDGIRNMITCQISIKTGFEGCYDSGTHHRP